MHGQLDQKAAETARGGLHEDPLARLDLGLPEQQECRTAVGQQRDRVLEVEAGRNRHHLVGPGQGAFGVAALPAGGGHHGRTDQGGVPTRSHGGDAAAHAVAGDAGERWTAEGAVARAHLGLDEGDARVRHIDE